MSRREAQRSGTVPADSTDFGPGAAVRFQDGSPIADIPGGFVEDELHVWGPLYTTLGVRADHFGPSDEWAADPRAALAWRVDGRQTLRVAAGRYHQLPRMRDLDPSLGNPRLGPVRADHVIVGYEWKSEYHDVRVEAYRKDYRGLPLQDAGEYYVNTGRGYARGVDLFARTDHRVMNGWISYGYLDSRRRERDDPREQPSPYGVRHSLTLVGTWQVAPVFQIGARYGYSTGRPFTPVLGGQLDATGGRWQPILGENFSAELPDYHRLDVRLTRLFSLPAGAGLPASSICVAYVEVMNALDTRNVLDYSYNLDYSERRAVDSYFSRRMAVAGFALTW